MTKLVLGLSLSLSLVTAGVAWIACGDDSTGAVDMSGTPPDAAATVDMTVSIKFGCNGYLTCMTQCFVDPAATLAGCKTICGKQAKNTATADKWNSALGCCQAHCAGPGDMAYKCILNTSTQKYTNLDGTDISGSDPGTGLKQCNQCLLDSCAPLFGNACTSMSSVDCALNAGDPIGCAATNTACTSDLP